jgi:hypothetical protein
MMRRTFLVAVLVSLAWTVPGCRTDERREADASAALAPSWVKTELYFGLARPDRSDITTAEWDAFLAGDVTPRFPDGLTVLDAHGQWRDASGSIVREKTKLLVLLYQGSTGKERAIDEVVRIYKERFHQEAILRVRSRADVSF